MRKINERFIGDLKTGELSFFLRQVRENPDVFWLGIRDGYVNVYYKGGNLLKITQKKKGYSFDFDEKYCLHTNGKANYDRVKSLPASSPDAYIENWQLLMEEMDLWFEEHPKPERQYQHKLLSKNPGLIDMEFAAVYRDENGEAKVPRFDMILLTEDGITLVENKVGTGAVSGSAGLAKHYRDMCRALRQEMLRKELSESVRAMIENKTALGLMNGGAYTWKEDNFKILFLLAGYNRNSQTMNNEIRSLEKIYPADVLMTGMDEYLIDLSRAEDFFAYGD